MSDGAFPSPTYAAAFRCIGSECEDTCCEGWAIPVDRQTYEKYREFPPGRLGSVVSGFVTITPNAPEHLYAQINVAASGCCAFLGADRLCAIQREYGPTLLSSTCSIYPRALNTVSGKLEGSLHLSCPEAARNVLLNADATQVAGDLHSGAFRTDSVAYLPVNGDGQIYKPYANFLAVRELLITIIRDRARSIEQRMMLIGAVCERLEQVHSPKREAGVPSMLAEYHQIVQRRQLISELDALPTAHGLQLDVILKLMAHRIREGKGNPRFAETCRLFLEGIGYASEPTALERTRRYVDAHRNYYQPFFASRPHSLENYLLNYLFQTLFPFGRAGSPYFHQQSILDEYILLATHFAWLRALLIGVAGAYKECFAEEHLVQTVQSFCRAIEHQPSVLLWMNELMRELRLDSPSGMAVLLRL